MPAPRQPGSASRPCLGQWIVHGPLHARGARYLDDTIGELNGALALASRAAAAAGAAAVLVIPADQPAVVPAEIEALLAVRLRRPHIVLASADDGGTGALLLAPPQAMAFAFGPDSAARHRAWFSRWSLRSRKSTGRSAM